MTKHLPATLALMAGVVASFGLAAVPAHAGYMAASDENFSYVGTVTAPDGTVYSIPSFVSTPGSTTYNGRDATIYATSGAPSADAPSSENYTLFETNWYSSLDGKNDGGSNPQNTNTGFAQLVDPSNASVTSATGGWTDKTYTTFMITITGGAAADPTNPDDRLWAAPEVGGPGVDTAGGFTNYGLTLTATFSPGAVSEESPGWFSTIDAPLSVTGSFTGTFDNDSTEAAAANGIAATPGLDGVYDFDLTFQAQNWAAANGILDVNGPYFGASQVPEPGSLALLGTALLGLGTIGWICKRRRAV